MKFRLQHVRHGTVIHPPKWASVSSALPFIDNSHNSILTALDHNKKVSAQLLHNQVEPFQVAIPSSPSSCAARDEIPAKITPYL